MGHHLGREQVFQFFPGARPMRAELAEQSDLVSLHSSLFQVIQKPRDHPVIGRRPGDVGEQDANATTWREPLPERGRTQRRLERCPHRALFIREGRGVTGLDHRGGVVGKYHRKATASVGQRNRHDRAVNPAFIGRKCEKQVFFKKAVAPMANHL
jgi:hypothetical protein